MKFNNLFKKLIIPAAGICAAAPVLLGATQVTAMAATNGVSASEAADWVRSLEGQGVDFDGSYGNQCVDLIKAYYNYLGETAPRGNADSYAYNSLPEGWSRLEGAEPQVGDILVYTGGAYGHVAIYTGENESYHQNWGGAYVQRVTGDCYSTGNGYWGVIRPDFEDSASYYEDSADNYSEDESSTDESYNYEEDSTIEETNDNPPEGYSYNRNRTFLERSRTPHRLYGYDYGFRPEGLRGERPEQ